MDHAQIQAFVDALWDDEIVPTLEEYIRIPNKSPIFDPDWKENGYMDQAVALAQRWVEQRNVPGANLEILQLEGRTPLLFMEIPGERPGTILLYGHLDKQPEFTGWKDGLSPWEPVIRDGKLYGRGGADDGYAIFASIAAIQALQEQGVPLPRIVITIECCEESGSYDLPHYVNAYEDRIGKPDLVVCLDSGCGDYDRLWATTSLRGLVAGNFKVEVLKEGVHSGDASGVVASSFRIARTLLSRIEDEETGKIIGDAFYTDIPAERVEQAAIAAEVLGDAVSGQYPFIDGMDPVSDHRSELVLNRTWRPALSVTGVGGMPAMDSAGNVLRPYTALKLSLRIPPHVDADVATKALKEALTTDVPYGAQSSFEQEKGAAGWEAPPTADWLASALSDASKTFFNQDNAAMGEGGTIPFMGMLGDKFPDAQFLITGVLGPASNAHGPNEFLHIPYAKKLTAAVAYIMSQLP